MFANSLKHYQACSRCIMDTTASDITFDSNGFCNYCSDFLIRQENRKKKPEVLNILLNKIKLEGKKKKYDCIIGVSGGVDSSFSLMKAVECGLKPLAVHMDNGWNTELAQNNISNLIHTLKVDLHTHVINWKEYKNFQEAFLRANVIDTELLYDNAMLAVNYRLADKFGVKYILSGTNTSTEGFKIPRNWSWFKNDAKNIRNIGKIFSNQKIDTFPTFGTFNFIYYHLIKKIKWILFPDYFAYNKTNALIELKNKCNYKPYPYKHYESVFTRFYQGYILPKKFGIDKRRLHLSNLILSSQMTRQQALVTIQQPTYPDLNDQEEDIKFFIKKMDWDMNRLNNYILEKEINHDFYGSEKKLWDNLKIVYKAIEKFRSFYR